jgi:hypothetical protein
MRRPIRRRPGWRTRTARGFRVAVNLPARPRGRGKIRVSRSPQSDKLPGRERLPNSRLTNVRRSPHCGPKWRCCRRLRRSEIATLIIDRRYSLVVGLTAAMGASNPATNARPEPVSASHFITAAGRRYASSAAGERICPALGKRLAVPRRGQGDAYPTIMPEIDRPLGERRLPRRNGSSALHASRSQHGLVSTAARSGNAHGSSHAATFRQNTRSSCAIAARAAAASGGPWRAAAQHARRRLYTVRPPARRRRHARSTSSKYAPNLPKARRRQHLLSPVERLTHCSKHNSPPQVPGTEQLAVSPLPDEAAGIVGVAAPSTRATPRPPPPGEHQRQWRRRPVGKCCRCAGPSLRHLGVVIEQFTMLASAARMPAFAATQKSDRRQPQH